jgi:hypothetical protein
MRAYADARPRGRAGLFILSARHGLLEADTSTHSYDQTLDLLTAQRLRPKVSGELIRAIDRLAAQEIVILAEPLYLVMCADVLAHPARPVVHWFPDPAIEFESAVQIFERWGWA